MSPLGRAQAVKCLCLFPRCFKQLKASSENQLDVNISRQGAWVLQHTQCCLGKGQCWSHSLTTSSWHGECPQQGLTEGKKTNKYQITRKTLLKKKKKERRKKKKRYSTSQHAAIGSYAHNTGLNILATLINCVLGVKGTISFLPIYTRAFHYLPLYYETFIF